MKIIEIGLLVILGFLQLSCNKNDEIPILVECEVSTFLGDFNLSEKSITFFPYQEFTKLVFNDSLGNETIFDLDVGEIISKDVEFHLPCESDTSIKTKYNLFAETYEINLNNHELGHSLKITMYTGTKNSNLRNYEKIDRISVSLQIDQDTSFYSSLLIMRNDEDEFVHTRLTFLDNFEINDKIFYNVYTYDNSISSNFPNYRIYINKEYGLVGIINPEIGLQLSFNRLE